MGYQQILLVEDNVDDVELAVRAFHKCPRDAKLEVAPNGEAALERLFAPAEAQGPGGALPSLVLLDLNLPGISGFDVLRRMRDNPSTRRIPVVVLTTSNERGDIVASYDLGANSYIRKPVQFADFTQIIEELEFYWLVTNTPPPP